VFSNVTKQDLIDLGTKILGLILTAVMGWIGLGHLKDIKVEAQAQTKLMQGTAASK
jgi:hypothetical protein